MNIIDIFLLNGWTAEENKLKQTVIISKKTCDKMLKIEFELYELADTKASLEKILKFMQENDERVIEVLEEYEDSLVKKDYEKMIK